MLTNVKDDWEEPRKEGGYTMDPDGIAKAVNDLPEGTTLYVSGRSSRISFPVLVNMVLCRGEWNASKRRPVWVEEKTGCRFDIVPDYRNGCIRFNSLRIQDRDVEFDRDIESIWADVPKEGVRHIVEDGRPYTPAPHEPLSTTWSTADPRSTWYFYK